VAYGAASSTLPAIVITKNIAIRLHNDRMKRSSIFLIMEKDLRWFRCDSFALRPDEVFEDAPALVPGGVAMRWGWMVRSRRLQ
jgi:hypothetical protein